MIPVRARGARPVWFVDGALAGALLVMGVAELLVRGGVSAIDALLALTPLVAVAWRRLAPVSAGVVVAGGMSVAELIGPGAEMFSQFLALMAVTVAVGEARNVVGGAAVFGALWVGVGADSDDVVADLAWIGTLIALPWLAGWAVDAHRQRTAELRELTRRLEMEREAGARLAVVEERARLAGEVHDAVGHTVAGMLAQAGASRDLLALDPERAQGALRLIQDSGRAAIDQLRVTLRILRSEPPEWEPDPAVDVPCCPPARYWRWPVAAEVALLTGLAALWAVEIVWFAYPVDGSRSVGIACAAIALAGVALRTRAPLAATVIVAGASVADGLLGGVWAEGISSVIAVLLVVYALGGHPVAWRAVGGGVIALVLVGGEEFVGEEPDPMDVLSVSVVLAIPWTAGWLARRYRERARMLAQLARELDGERVANARLAVLAERTHVARELHDTIAHGVSVMIVQAAAAEHAARHDIEVARAAIDAIAFTGRQALADLQRLLALLAFEPHAAPHAPQPTLAELDALVEQVRRAGLPVTLRVEGTPAPVAPDIAGTAYRITQEALTNVLKHAGRPRTAVVVRYLPDALDLAIADDGPGAGPGHGGHGVIGMHERARLAGGELQAGPRAAGGYAVRARLPLDGAVG